MPRSNMEIIWTLVFEWYVVWCASNNGHLKEMCLKEIGSRAQNILIIFSLIINMIEEGIPYSNGRSGTGVPDNIINHGQPGSASEPGSF